MSLLSRAKKIVQGKQEAAEKKGGQPSQTSAGEADNKKTVGASSELAMQIGLTPLLTEKSFEAQAGGNAAAFRVHLRASKQEIARAVHEQYGAEVLNVRTTRMRGKLRRRGTTYGTTPAWKKAYVQVKDIQSLQITP